VVQLDNPGLLPAHHMTAESLSERPPTTGAATTNSAGRDAKRRRGESSVPRVGGDAVRDGRKKPMQDACAAAVTWTGRLAPGGGRRRRLGLDWAALERAPSRRESRMATSRRCAAHLQGWFSSSYPDARG
jgi:hypothetical protein